MNSTGRGVSVEFVKNNLTFSGKADPMAKLMLTVLAAFGEFERDLIRERQREGIAIAKAKGVYKGRKKALTAEQAAELVECARSGMPKAELARSYGISRETLYQYLRAGEPARARLRDGICVEAAMPCRIPRAPSVRVAVGSCWGRAGHGLSRQIARRGSPTRLPTDRATGP